MTPARRCAVALVAVAAVFLSLRLVTPDAALRRDWMLALLLPLGYAHQLGAWWRGRRASAARAGSADGGARVRVDAVRRVAGLVCLTSTGVLLWALAGAWWPGVAFALAFVAAWHVVENELAMAAVVAGVRPRADGRLRPCTTRLPPVPRSLSRQALAIGVSALCLALAASTPWWTHALLRSGVPASLARWTAEECVAALLLHHVLSWALFVWEGAATHAPRERRRRRRTLLALHAAPTALAGLLFATAPAAFAALAAPAPYLLTSAAHALQTARQRRVPLEVAPGRPLPLHAGGQTGC